MAVASRSRQDKLFDFMNYCILTVALVLVLYPIYFIIIASISNPNLVSAGRVLFWPKEITMEGYQRIINYPRLWVGYKNTILYAVIGTTINLTLTLTAAYSLSRKDLKGRNLIMGFLVFTMLFSGGLIPRYLLIMDLGMLNTIWAMVIPNAVGVWNVIIAKTFFQTTLPEEMLEAAVIDGCSNTNFFVRIVLPLSPAIIAVLALFYGVGHWNAFFDALIFLRDQKLYPLQIILREILISTQLLGSGMFSDGEIAAEQARIAESIKYGVIIIASVPILVFYPLLQKYFVKGVMIGAIKG